MKLRVGDTVQVIAGSDLGKTGEIIQILRKEDRVIVEGVNMVTKHLKPSQADPEGGVVTREAPIDVSNVAYYDTKAKATVKIGYEGQGKDKIRINKSTGKALDKKKK